jgi:hypothetical protein
MVDGLHIHMQNKTMKHLAIALSGEGKDLQGADDGDDLTNVQCKVILICHNESPMNNECILIKMGKNF